MTFYYFIAIIIVKISLLRPIHAQDFPAALSAQTRVRGHSDTVALAKFDELGLLEVHVVFHLQVGRLDLAVVQHPLYLFNVEVRQADRLCSAASHLFLHHLYEISQYTSSHTRRPHIIINFDSATSTSPSDSVCNTRKSSTLRTYCGAFTVGHNAVLYYLPNRQVVRAGIDFHLAIGGRVTSGHAERSVHQVHVDVVQLQVFERFY